MLTFQSLHNLEHTVKVCHECFYLSICLCGFGIFVVRFNYDTCFHHQQHCLYV
jgi:hypothetical protein